MPQCKKCLNSFPNAIKIDYKWKFLKGRSYCLTCSPFGARNRRSLKNYSETEGTKRCTSCDRWLELSKFSERHDRAVKSSRCKDCLNRTKKRIANEIKSRAIEYKGSKCHDCLLLFPAPVYEFHHRDPAHKDFTISDKKSMVQWEAIKIELDKCDMLCANCHRLRHYGDKI